MNRILKYVAVPLLALVLAGGNQAFAQSSDFPSGVTGTEWKLLQIERAPGDMRDTSNLNVTISFDGQGLAGGESTCNLYSAPYQTSAGSGLTFGDVISTLRACVDSSLMDIETEFYSALDSVTSYSFDGTTLRLVYNNGASTLLFGTGSTPPSPPPPGMPRTGSTDPNYTAFMTVGAMLALFGTAFLFYRLRRASTESR